MKNTKATSGRTTTQSLPMDGKHPFPPITDAYSKEKIQNWRKNYGKPGLKKPG